MNFTSICTPFDFGHSYCKEFVTFISYKRKKEDEKLATLFPIPYCTDKQFQNSNDTNFGTRVSFLKVSAAGSFLFYNADLQVGQYSEDFMARLKQ